MAAGTVTCTTSPGPYKAQNVCVGERCSTNGSHRGLETDLALRNCNGDHLSVRQAHITLVTSALALRNLKVAVTMLEGNWSRGMT